MRGFDKPLQARGDSPLLQMEEQASHLSRVLYYGFVWAEHFRYKCYTTVYIAHQVLHSQPLLLFLRWWKTSVSCFQARVLCCSSTLGAQLWMCVFVLDGGV